KNGLLKKFDGCGHCLPAYSNYTIKKTPTSNKFINEEEASNEEENNNEEEASNKKETSNEEETSNKFRNNKEEKSNKCNFSTIYPIDDSSEHQVRRKKCAVYIGEFVQARYTLCDNHKYNTWIIVGLLNAGTGRLYEENCNLKQNNLGRVGDKSFGFAGWTYGAVDHDVCQIEYVKATNGKFGIATTLGCCTDEFLSASPSFIAKEFKGLTGYDPEKEYDGTLTSNCNIKYLLKRNKNITYIHFYLLADAYVKLELCLLITGKIIKTFKGYRTTGEQKIEWNDKADTGKTAPAGEYICKFTCTPSAPNGIGVIPECIKITDNEKKLISDFIIEKNKEVKKGEFIRKTCWACKGKGKYSCLPCRGRGNYSCLVCKGKGITSYKALEWEKKEKDCWKCKGSGKISYRVWVWRKGKYVRKTKTRDCGVCKGNRITYYWTHAWKEKTKTCWSCKGDKKLPCLLCGERGNYPCSVCGGDGVFTDINLHIIEHIAWAIALPVIIAKLSTISLIIGVSIPVTYIHNFIKKKLNK
ncbi:MAG: hypothetical protein KAQ75_07380, partial [Bacteroidales bacterium]|nr:hypothetical protein [Bacteroidales bacterium]